MLADTEALVEVLTDWLSLTERLSLSDRYLLACFEASSDKDWLWLTETDKLSA